jgi:hypothetical protein
MSDTSALTVDGAADHIVSLLGNDDVADAPVTPIEQLSDEAKADRIASEPEPEAEVKAPVEGEVEASQEAKVEPEVPAIEPPVSWNADAKERFKALPPDLQKYVAERESERDRGLSKTQQETAEAKKAAEAERIAVNQERQALHQRLSASIGYAETTDPVIAEGRKTDWPRFIRENPAEGMAKLVEYQQRESALKQQVAMREDLQNRMAQDALRKAEDELATKLDFWKDKDKRSTFQSELRKYLVNEGYSSEEIAAVSDARAIVLGRKAMLYDQLMAQQATIADKKKAPTPAKTVLKSQASNESSQSEKAASAIKRVHSTSRTEEQAAIIAGLL